MYACGKGNLHSSTTVHSEAHAGPVFLSAMIYGGLGNGVLRLCNRHESDAAMISRCRISQSRAVLGDNYSVRKSDIRQQTGHSAAKAAYLAHIARRT